MVQESRQSAGDPAHAEVPLSTAGRWMRAVASSLRLLLALFAWHVISAGPSLAVPADITLDQMAHTRWTTADGAPAIARAMAQTADGALWIGTEQGLYRFDGAQFERVRAKDGSAVGAVAALAATPDGGLWIGLSFGGGALHWKSGLLTTEGQAAGLPVDRSIRCMALGTDGRLWAGTTEGIFMREAGRWRRVDKDIGHPGGHVYHITIDRKGTLWLTGRDGIYSLPPGAKAVERHRDGDEFSFIAVGPEGGAWASLGPTVEKGGELVAVRPSAKGKSRAGIGYPAGDSPGPVILDRNGGLWTEYRHRVMRLPNPAALSTWGERPPPQAELLGAERGLSGQAVYGLLEDRDGNIWVSTEQGLDRLKIPRLRATIEIDGAGLGLDDEGQPLFCTYNTGVRSVHGVVPALARTGSKCDSMTQEPSGRRWFGIDGRIWWWHKGQVGQLPLPADVQPVLSIAALQADADGALWAAFVRKGLYRYRDERWTFVEPEKNGFPEGRPVAMSKDAAGHVWMAYAFGRLARVDGEHAVAWGKDQGLKVGNIAAMAPYGDAMMAGGLDGVALIADGKVREILTASGEHMEGIGGIVVAKDGAYWIHAGSAIVRIPSEEMRRVRADPSYRPVVERFGLGDGLRGVASTVWPSPSAVRASDGRLWFSTSTATYVLDPERLPRNPRPPVVELRSLRVEGEDHALQDEQQLPVGVRRLEFGFAALLITAPERVNYRYRLDGLETAWQHTQARSASYTNLPPGRYTFRVSASNEDGVWNDTGVATRFVVPPAFWQTGWFYTSCALAAGLTVWGIYRLRVRQLTRTIRLRAEAQAQERERIARDLHDTLLQSTQGLMLNVQALADRIPADHPDKARLDRALDLADRAVLEGRRKVLDLRTGDFESNLGDLLGDLASELDERGPAKVEMRVDGELRRLAAEAHSEALRVGQEALLNAHRHAQAKRIEVLVEYGVDALRLRVADDGIGMSAALMDGSQLRPGHFGLTGLRERAAALTAELTIQGRDGGGTVVELRIPAGRAYASS